MNTEFGGDFIVYAFIVDERNEFFELFFSEIWNALVVSCMVRLISCRNNNCKVNATEFSKPASPLK